MWRLLPLFACLAGCTTSVCRGSTGLADGLYTVRIVSGTTECLGRTYVADGGGWTRLTLAVADGEPLLVGGTEGTTCETMCDTSFRCFEGTFEGPLVVGVSTWDVCGQPMEVEIEGPL